MTRRLILIGMPASGKTTVGRELSRALAVPFYDCDEAVEREAGCTIAGLFAAEGEASFRERERRMLETLCAKDAPCVIATGGGAVLRRENRLLLRRSGVVFWLDRSMENIMSADCGGRPLLAGGEAALRKLYDERRELYAGCGHLFIPDGTIRQVTSRILRIWEELP